MLNDKKRAEKPAKAKAAESVSATDAAVAAEIATLEAANRLPEAVQACRRQLLLTPADGPLWARLGRLLQQLGYSTAAAGCFSRALEQDPADVAALSGRANALMALDRADESLALHAAAAKLAPKSFPVLASYGIALRECNRQEQALKYFDAALALEPGNHIVAWERVLARLDLGLFAETWADFELRWKQRPGIERSYPRPRWTGEDLKGKTIFIYEEQGFGDTILCSRYLPLVKARGARVIFEAKPELHRLFSHKGLGVDKIFTAGAQVESFDYHCPLMSLPGIFGTDLASIPPVPPLHVPGAIPAGAAALLTAGGARLKVGIVWSGSATFTRNRRRATGAERFLPLAEIPGVQLYSLQKGPLENELGACGGRSLVWELGPHVNDFAETAAVLAGLDLVIMTDSSVAHLAGSLGTPVWNLLNHRPYWLYLKDRTDSPWYPSMRLFRQQTPGDWDAVFKDVAAALEKAVAQKKASQKKGR